MEKSRQLVGWAVLQQEGHPDVGAQVYPVDGVDPKPSHPFGSDVDDRFSDRLAAAVHSYHARCATQIGTIEQSVAQRRGKPRARIQMLDVKGAPTLIANANNIWQVPAYLPYLQPSLTDESIVDAERKLGFPLPADFLNLLRKQNGGYIRYSLPDMVHSLIAGIGPNFPSLTDFDWTEDQEQVSFPLHGLVPFDGDGHWHICLDFRKNVKNPSVTYIDVECDSISRVADSFGAYLSMLKIECTGEYVIDSITDIEDFKSKLSATLHREFASLDDSAHGYPIHRAALGNKTKPEWLWISPNLVQRGFVRRSHDRYEQLKSMMSGQGLRFVELSEKSYLVSATDGVLVDVVDACAKLGFSIRPLSDHINGI